MGLDYKKHHNARFLLGDVRDRQRLVLAMEKVDYVFHAAALKHVPSCEYNPFEAIKTNVEGTLNVIDVANYSSVKRLVNISTDKVTNAVSTMGATKLLAERLISAAEYRRSKCKFASVRFGNVLGSNGSVWELFRNQLRLGKPLTVTDIRMTRFIMTIVEAVKLVFKCASEMHGGETYILKMPVVKMKDLVEVLREDYHCEVEMVGIRPGEKLYEDLMTKEEAFNVREEEEYYCILPGVGKTPFRKSYSTRHIKPMSKGEIRESICRFLQ